MVRRPTRTTVRALGRRGRTCVTASGMRQWCIRTAVTVPVVSKRNADRSMIRSCMLLVSRASNRRSPFALPGRGYWASFMDRPSTQGNSTLVAIAVVCSHPFGLVLRQLWAAGPDDIRSSVPYHVNGLRVRCAQRVRRSPVRPYLPSTTVLPALLLGRCRPMRPPLSASTETRGRRPVSPTRYELFYWQSRRPRHWSAAASVTRPAIASSCAAI
jgi:hypothetical protein